MVDIILSNKSPCRAHVYTSHRHAYTHTVTIATEQRVNHCGDFLWACHACECWVPATVVAGMHTYMNAPESPHTKSVTCEIPTYMTHIIYLHAKHRKKITYSRFAKQQYLTDRCLFNIQAHLQSDCESFLSVFLLIPLAESRVLYIYFSLKLQQTAWQTGGGCLKGL